MTCFSLECCIRKVSFVNRGILSHRLKNKGLEFKARCVHDYKKKRGLYKKKLRIVKSWVYDFFASLSFTASHYLLSLSLCTPPVLLPSVHHSPMPIHHLPIAFDFVSFILTRREEKRRDEARREEKSVACDNGLMTFLLLSLLQSGPPDNVFV